MARTAHEHRDYHRYLHQTVRRIGTALRPNVLNTLGLTTAIAWQLQDIQQRTALTYTLQKPPQDLTLDQVRATAVFRIFQQVLLMLGEGKTVKEIAGAMSLSVKTISTYRMRILRKLHLHTTADLIRYVLSQQLLSQPASHATPAYR